VAINAKSEKTAAVQTQPESGMPLSNQNQPNRMSEKPFTGKTDEAAPSIPRAILRYRENPSKYIAKALEWKTKNPERQKLNKDRWNESNREKNQAYQKEYRAANQSALSDYHKSYRQANAEKAKAYGIEYRRKNKDRLAQAKSEWSKKNAERTRKNQLAWLCTNEGKASSDASRGRRRAAKKNTQQGSSRDIAKWFKSWRTIEFVECSWCKNAFNSSECEGDHIVPLSKGGAHRVDNLCISCGPCNRRKSAKLPEIWVAELASNNQTKQNHE